MDNLIRSIERELANPEHAGRSHGSRSTYNKGCHGPLCRKANRDYGRERHDCNERRGARHVARDAVLAQWIARINESSAQSA